MKYYQTFTLYFAGTFFCIGLGLFLLAWISNKIQKALLMRITKTKAASGGDAEEVLLEYGVTSPDRKTAKPRPSPLPLSLVMLKAPWLSLELLL